MTAYSKWGISLVCVLIPAWLLADSLFFDAPLSPKTASSTKQLSKQVSKELAEQQLANGLVLWRDKKYQQASQQFSALASQQLSIELQALTDLYQYHSAAFIQNKNQVQNKNSAFIQQVITLPADCKQKLLFVTPDIESLAQAEHFRTRFAQDPRLESLSICIYEVTWFDPVDISCDENWQQSGRLGCQLLSLAEKLKNVPFTHLVVFANKGKANVHNGIMFLDRQDSYDVFIHELAHFSGFVDEYPLTQELAKRVCAGVDAPNIVFKHPKQLDIDRQYWQSIGLQDHTDLVTARTCDNHPTQAFKASNKLTFMEYHDTAYIPVLYLTAWQRQLQKKPNQPSAHINFAQLYEQSNNLSESEFWRTRYQQYIGANTNENSNL